MRFDQAKLNAAIETARAKANGNRALLNAIDRAVDGLRDGWIVSELHDGLLITSDSGETYKANGTCGCRAYQNGMICKHRVAYRIVSIYHETPEPKRPAPRVVRSVERDIITHRAITVYTVDGWAI